MRGKIVRGWRPVVGVVALGIFAFGWSLQGMAGVVDSEPVASNHMAVPLAADVSAVAAFEEVDIPDAWDVPHFTPSREIRLDVDVPMLRFPPGREPVGRAFGSRDDECTCDLDCADGDPCTADTCEWNSVTEEGTCHSNTEDAEGRQCDDGDAGLFCNTGGCDNAGNCVEDGGGSPCDADDEYCDEANSECDWAYCVLGAPYPPCDDGFWCNGTEACDVNDQCPDADNPCDPGYACDGTEETCTEFASSCCDPTHVVDCALINYDVCDGGRVWSWIDSDSCQCPEVSQGVMEGAGLDVLVGIHPAILGEEECENFYKLGDDYTIRNGGETDYLNLDQFRFYGGVEDAGDGLVLRFWDASASTTDPTYVGGLSGTLDTAGQYFWTFSDVDMIIPPVGYVTMETYDDTSVAYWATADEVSTIEAGNPAIVWMNDGPRAYFSDATFWDPAYTDHMAFEMFGELLTEVPLGACCDNELGTCTQTLEWFCEGVFFGVGIPCDPNPCLAGACCQGTDGTCDVVDSQGECEAEPYNGVWLGFATNCDPNCCTVLPFTGGDNCNTAIVHEIVVPPTTLDPPVVVTISGNNSTATYNCVSCTTDSQCDEYGGICCGDGAPCIPDGCCILPDPLGDDCTPSWAVDNEDLGWYEAFKVVDFATGPDAACANITVDFCCTTAEWPSTWTHLKRDCDEPVCGTIVGREDYDYCPGGDGLIVYYGNIPGGEYVIPIISDRLDPAYFGDYQVHITVTACQEAVCCLPPDENCEYPQDDDPEPPNIIGDGCIITSQLECDAAGGYFLASNGSCEFPTPACETGVCCTGPGECEETAMGYSCEYCQDTLGVTYVGGPIVCEPEEGALPCPVCEVSGADHCQNGESPPASTAWLCDRDFYFQNLAEDFKAQSDGTITFVCFEATIHPACDNENNYDADNWRITFYNDGGGFPGTKIGDTQIIPSNSDYITKAFSRAWNPTAEVYDYSVLLPTPVAVSLGETYWMMISGAGECSQGIAWMATVTLNAPWNGNRYMCFTHTEDDEGNWYDPVWQISDCHWNVDPDDWSENDLDFCFNIELDDPQALVWACCMPDTSCVFTDPWDCEDIGGSLWHGYDCGGDPPPDTPLPDAQCMPPPDNDTCADIVDWAPFTIDILAKGTQTISGHNYGADCDGREYFICEPIGASTMDYYDHDVWYYMTTGSNNCGQLEIAACDFCVGGSNPGETCHSDAECDGGTCSNDTTYDNFIQLYDTCTCPGGSVMNSMQCNDEGCVYPDALGDAGFLGMDEEDCEGNSGVVGVYPNSYGIINLEGDHCYYLRVGGWVGTAGTSGEGFFDLEVTYVDAACGGPTSVERPDPVEWSSEDYGHNTVGGRCTTDADCTTTAGAVSECYCIIDEGVGETEGSCYLPCLRYLQVDNSNNSGTATALRVRIDGDPCGDVEWWVGEPQNPGDPYNMTIATLVASPVYRSSWPAQLDVTDCEIVGGQTYIVQAIPDTGDIGDEGDYSAPLNLKTPTLWGDVAGTCSWDKCLGPNLEVNIDDILAEIAHFQGGTTNPNGPHAQFDIAPALPTNSVPNQEVNIDEILGTIQGFQANPYLGAGPCGC